MPLVQALPLTKFRVPRARRELLARPGLLATLHASVESHPVTLICAPAGFGKTTLMAQLADDCAGPERAVWVALDESDDDPAHLLATLVQSLSSLNLQWDRDPAALVANVAGRGSEARAVLAGIVNALCTASTGRLIWLLDDLHRLGDSATLALLEALIERLPEHVALVIGSRLAPVLPLARLRAHGELSEFGSAELSFDESCVRLLAQRRWGVEPTAEQVAETLRRTEGWAAGINLVLMSQGGEHGAARDDSRGNCTPRALFEFLAQEVFAELPRTLQRFSVACAVLPELDPLRCAAVTEDPNAREQLNALNRRNLFLSVVDEHVPVLRFHDLFRDFLLAQLAAEPEEYRRSLHVRAALAETQAERAIEHWLQAEQWSEAAALLVRDGLQLVAAGSHVAVERWIDQLQRQLDEPDPNLALLSAECAWARWDWQRVREQSELATQGFSPRDHSERRMRALVLLAATLGALGQLEARQQLTEQSFKLPLSVGDSAQFHLQRGWSDFALGESGRVGKHLAKANELIAEDPARWAPGLAQNMNCHYGGLPGVVESYLRYAELCESVPKPAVMPWHATPLILSAWAALWQGRREATVRALERGEQIQQQFGKVRYVLMDACQLRALYLAATGDFAGARRVIQNLLDELEHDDAAGPRAVWARPYRHVLARVLWIGLDRTALAEQAVPLAAPRQGREWPFVGPAADTVRGQAALLAGDLDAAQSALEAAVALHVRYPAPAFYPDPRVALAQTWLQRGFQAKAWATFLPVLDEVERDATPGRLLLEPPSVIQGLLALCPRSSARRRAVTRPRSVLQDWWQHDAPAQPRPTSATGPSLRLSERECEVMELVASGLPNKLLARQLDLSLHTVKRHVANILAKLDCDNRGQAADLWRREGPRAL